MENTKQYYYSKVAKALQYLENNFKEQPSLDEVAQYVNSSPYHFQKIFSEWVGVSPKKYLQYISVQHAKMLLCEKTLASTAEQTGLSGTGRLHDLFVTIEGMSPGEYKNGGKNLEICYRFSESNFGSILIASTSKGICHIGFTDNETDALYDLTRRFPNARITAKEVELQNTVVSFFSTDWNNIQKIKLHLKGTDFQLKVWDALLKIPMGKLSTYGEIAEHIGKPKASRAVGTAIGNNPVALIIPCHRVIQSTGNYGQYHWNSVRKKAMIGWEIAKSDQL